MPEPKPAIIQGTHPFKVEAVLSKTGGVNALAKRAQSSKKRKTLALTIASQFPAKL